MLNSELRIIWRDYGMKKKERLSQYLDELGSEDVKMIENASMPWQKNFLFRFYEQLRKKKLKKADVCCNVNEQTDKYHLLYSKEYTHKLNVNTLTQYTSFKAEYITPISVVNLIAVSNALDVSINYLLGIDSCESPENTDINKVTGLSNETIDIIKKNKGLQNKLNFFLSSPNLTDIEYAINRECYMQHISQDILNAYSETLLKKIETAYQKFNLELFPLDRTAEKFGDYLCIEITLREIKETTDTESSIIDYLKLNLSQDIVNQIQLSIQENQETSDINIYTAFIYDTAQRTYEILEHKYSREIRMGKIIQSFQLLLEDYIQEQVKENKNNIRHNIKATD